MSAAANQVIIVIPARMGSTRFPGKPLAEIAGVSMIRRTAHMASLTGLPYVVATDHDEIAAHCKTHSIECVMTEPELASGSDRALAATNIFAPDAEIIVNLQGDAPFTPVEHLQAVIETLQDCDAEIATPYVKLGWSALDELREHKIKTPFSGTTLITDAQGYAVWFSKNIIPALRKEDELRKGHPLSPICRHIGLYAYRRSALERFVTWPESYYEKLEGLEQLRALQNGLRIKAVEVDPPTVAISGIDTPLDLKRAKALLRQTHDPFGA